MQKKLVGALIGFLVLFFISLSAMAVFSKDYESAVQPYKDNYFLFGNMEDQVKFQISMKFNLIYPSDIGMYIGYSQLTQWFIYGKRDTMWVNYQPELIYKFESGKNIFNNAVIPFVDYIQMSPIYHCSTGVEGENHRAMNQYYGQIQLSYGDVYNFGVNGRYHRYWSISSYNKDINSYRLNYEASVFFKLKSKTVNYLDKEEIAFKCSGNPLNKGYYIVEAKTRIITTYFQPRLMIQYQHGYSDIFVNYNKKEECVRVGISIE